MISLAVSPKHPSSRSQNKITVQKGSERERKEVANAMRPFYFLLSVLLLLAAAGRLPLSCGHNITRILAQHPEFSTFNHYLTVTHLAGEINRRQTLTVLALTNSAMSSVLSRHLPLPTLKNLLSLHILVDYFGAKKLHQLTAGTALASTIFQSTGTAPGTSGFVNITDLRAGHVSFTAEGSDTPSSFVKSIKELPYNLSVIQISAPLSSPAAEAPTPAPSQIDFISVMSKKGCKTFADLLTAGTGEVAKTFEDNVDSGLTVFCPIDQAMKAFMPKFKNLTAEHKTSMLLYHGIPVYNSLAMLKSDNGVVNTLATDGRSKDFNLTVQNEGEVVTLKTRVTTASITGTLVDEDPLAVYTIDEVLEPRELFKAAKAPAPEPAAADAPAAADSPKGAKKKEKKKKHVHALSPAPAGPEEQPADDDQVADDNSGRRACVQRGVAAAAVTVAAAALIIVV